MTQSPKNELIENSATITSGEIERVAALFGGAPVLHQDLKTALDAHDMLAQGLPSSAMGHLVSNLTVLQQDDALERAVGMSIRTFQRRKKNPAKLLTREQSGRTWTFAGILARATSVFGSKEEAEHWLERPALGLNQRRPIDLLATSAGAEIVEVFLRRLEHGVYT